MSTEGHPNIDFQVTGPTIPSAFSPAIDWYILIA